MHATDTNEMQSVLIFTRKMNTKRSQAHSAPHEKISNEAHHAWETIKNYYKAKPSIKIVVTTFARISATRRMQLQATRNNTAEDPEFEDETNAFQVEMFRSHRWKNI